MPEGVIAGGVACDLAVVKMEKQFEVMERKAEKLNASCRAGEFRLYNPGSYFANWSAWMLYRSGTTELRKY